MMLGRLRQMLPTIFASIGVLSLAIAAGLLLVVGEADRWVLTAAALGAIFIVYAILERPEGVQKTLTGRELRYGGNTLLMTVAFVGIVGLLNVLGARHSFRWDLTESQDFTVSPQSVQVVQQLDAPVRIIAFYRQDQFGREELEDLLREYTRHTNQISYEFVDPELRPGLANQYQIQSYGTTVIESEGQRQTIMSSNEADLTSALLKLQRGETKKVAWTVGHGELDVEGFDQGGASEAKRLIEQEGYTLEPLSLLTVAEIPQDVAVVVLAGAREPLQPQEIEVLDAYLKRGGKLLALVEPHSPGNPTDLLDRWGVEVGEGVIVDLQLNLRGDPFTLLVLRFTPNSIMRGSQAGGYVTVLPGATMVRIKSERDPVLLVQSLAESSAERSWLETNRDVSALRFDEGQDIQGPISLAVSVQRNLPGQPADSEQGGSSTRVVAIGNAAFASNTFLSFNQVPGNRDLLMNSINWLAEDEQLMSVRAQVDVDRTLFLSGPEQNFLFYSSFLFLPALVLAAGFWIWWARR